MTVDFDLFESLVFSYLVLHFIDVTSSFSQNFKEIISKISEFDVSDEIIHIENIQFRPGQYFNRHKINEISEGARKIVADYNNLSF